MSPSPWYSHVFLRGSLPFGLCPVWVLHPASPRTGRSRSGPPSVPRFCRGHGAPRAVPQPRRRLRRRLRLRTLRRFLRGRAVARSRCFPGHGVPPALGGAEQRAQRHRSPCSAPRGQRLFYQTFISKALNRLPPPPPLSCLLQFCCWHKTGSLSGN